MRETTTLTRPLDCTSSSAERFTLPAGYQVTVHHATQRSVVVLDGRVYRAATHDVWMATR